MSQQVDIFPLAICPTDILKLILDWLSLQSLSSIATVCKRFNIVIDQVLEQRALRDRIVEEEFNSVHQLLKLKLKRWEYYLLVKLSFYEIEDDSIKLNDSCLLLCLAIYHNRNDLLKKWVMITYKEIAKQKRDTYGWFLYFCELCSIFHRNECFLSLLRLWPEAYRPKESSDLLKVGFLSTFSEGQIKLISQRLKFIPPTILFLAKKFANGNLQVEKLLPEQQELAYDCYPEDKLHLLEEISCRNLAYHRIQCRKDKFLRTCYFHSRWLHPIERIYLYYDSLIKEKGVQFNFKVQSPQFCLKYDLEECQLKLIQNREEIIKKIDGIIDKMIFPITASSSYKLTYALSKTKEFIHKRKILENVLEKEGFTLANFSEEEEEMLKILKQMRKEMANKHPNNELAENLIIAQILDN